MAPGDSQEASGACFEPGGLKWLLEALRRPSAIFKGIRKLVFLRPAKSDPDIPLPGSLFVGVVAR